MSEPLVPEQAQRGGDIGAGSDRLISISLERHLVGGLIYALALRVSSVLHEGAHALVGWLGGASFTINEFTVHAVHVSPRVGIAMAVAGPSYSVLQGTASLLALRAMRPKNGALHLLLVWLCLHGFSAGFGYMLMPIRQHWRRRGRLQSPRRRHRRARGSRPHGRSRPAVDRRPLRRAPDALR